MSGASGKVPAAIHVSPGSARPAARSPACATATSSVSMPWPARSQALVDAAEWDRRETGAADAGAARRQRPRPGPRTVRRHAPQRVCGRGGRLHMAVSRHCRCSTADARRSRAGDPGDRRSNDVAHAVPMARALVAGGIRMLEVTLRTAAALACIEAIAREVPEAIVGAGTVRSAADARAAHGAGARFARQPGLHARASPRPAASSPAAAARRRDGSEVDGRGRRRPPLPQVLSRRAAGGPALLKAWAGPFGDIAFCPTGGITPASRRSSWRCRTSRSSAARG